MLFASHFFGEWCKRGPRAFTLMLSAPLFSLRERRTSAHVLRHFCFFLQPLHLPGLCTRETQSPAFTLPQHLFFSSRRAHILTCAVRGTHIFVSSACRRPSCPCTQLLSLRHIFLVSYARGGPSRPRLHLHCLQHTYFSLQVVRVGHRVPRVHIMLFAATRRQPSRPRSH